MIARLRRMAQHIRDLGREARPLQPRDCMRENGDALAVRDSATTQLDSFLRETYPVLEMIIATTALARWRSSARALRAAISDATSRFWPPLLEPMLPSSRSRSRRHSE